MSGTGIKNQIIEKNASSTLITYGITRVLGTPGQEPGKRPIYCFLLPHKPKCPYTGSWLNKLW